MSAGTKKVSGSKPESRVPFLDLRGLYEQHREEFDLAIASVLSAASYVKGPAVTEFEKNFGAWLGKDIQAVGCANGTEAITIAARALELPAGSTAIVPAMTFFGTVEGLVHAGLKIRPVDVLPNSWLMDPKAVEAAMGPDVSVIVPVHLYGQMTPMTQIAAIAKRAGCRILEDAAQAHGSLWEGKAPGAFGDVATFSFYPGKNLGAFGDGGAVASRDAALLERVRMLGSHGGLVKYRHDVVGYNSRLDSVQAAVLNVKLKYIDGWNEARRKIAATYRKELAGLTALTLPMQHEQATHVYHLFVVATERRDALAAFLLERGIENGLHYPQPIHRLAALAGQLPTGRVYPNAERLARTGLSLPMCPLMSVEQAHHVAVTIREFFR